MSFPLPIFNSPWIVFALRFETLIFCEYSVTAKNLTCIWYHVQYIKLFLTSKHFLDCHLLKSTVKYDVLIFSIYLYLYYYKQLKETLFWFFFFVKLSFCLTYHGKNCKNVIKLLFKLPFVHTRYKTPKLPTYTKQFDTKYNFLRCIIHS